MNDFSRAADASKHLKKLLSCVGVSRPIMLKARQRRVNGQVGADIVEYLVSR
jgi:hypothetical protein